MGERARRRRRNTIRFSALPRCGPRAAPPRLPSSAAWLSSFAGRLWLWPGIQLFPGLVADPITDSPGVDPFLESGVRKPYGIVQRR